ncbi:MAG: hypothetical protein AB1489_19700 [Acidobacteriota bacterium]
MKTKTKPPLIKEQPAAPRSFNIHCPVFNHIKNTMVCSLCCSLRDRCSEFQAFYAHNRSAQDALVNDYIESHRQLPPGSLLIIQYSLEVLRKMSDTYVWIGQDDHAEVMSLEQILQAADEGRKPKHIFLTKQELILRYQLVPKSRQEAPVKESAAKVKVVEPPEATEVTEVEDKRRRRGRAVA